MYIPNTKMQVKVCQDRIKTGEEYGKLLMFKIFIVAHCSLKLEYVNTRICHIICPNSYDKTNNF